MSSAWTICVWSKKRALPRIVFQEMLPARLVRFAVTIQVAATGNACPNAIRIVTVAIVLLAIAGVGGASMSARSVRKRIAAVANEIKTALAVNELGGT